MGADAGQLVLDTQVRFFNVLTNIETTPKPKEKKEVFIYFFFIIASDIVKRGKTAEMQTGLKYQGHKTIFSPFSPEL